MNLQDLGRSLELARGGARYLGSSAATLAGVALQRGLHREDSVQLDRPLLGVVGFMGRPGCMSHLMRHLSSEGNGHRVYYCKDDQIYRDRKFQDPLPASWSDPDARLFQLVPHDPGQGPHLTAERMGPALQQIAAITGQSKTDVLAHSMGGIATRIYIARGGCDIGKFMMVGTPNQGTRAATLAGWAMSQGIGRAAELLLGPAVAGSLQWLRAVEDGNPELEALNARWAQDKGTLEDVRVVGAGGRLTANSSATGWGDGDGLIHSGSLSLPETPATLLPGSWTQGHKALMHDRQVFAEMRSFFGWTQTTQG